MEGFIAGHPNQNLRPIGLTTDSVIMLVGAVTTTSSPASPSLPNPLPKKHLPKEQCLICYRLTYAGKFTVNESFGFIHACSKELSRGQTSKPLSS